MSEFGATLGRLYSLIGRGRRRDLGPMLQACERLGHPEKSFPAVHVTGTNGKGSTCAFVASIAKAAGQHVGLFTSPHLIKVAERIQIDGSPVADSGLARLVDKVLDVAPDLTFFETLTLAAFLAFQEAEVDLAVIEVGLGGRLDATNVLPSPRVAAITRVAYDHMEELGDSLEAIATEKAGIIKPGCAVVLGKLHPGAREVIEKHLHQVGAHLVPLGSPEPIPGMPLAYPRVAMIGSNLALAVTIGRELGFSPETIAAGVEATHWPGRNELLHRNGLELTLLDCAHNPDGAVALSHVLDPSVLGEIESRRDVALVFGAIQSKNWRSMLQRLEHVSYHRVFVAPPVSKAVDPQLMVQAMGGEIAPNIADGLARARTLVGPRGVVVVTGSTYLVGAARATLLGIEPDPAVEM
jgi:dihydrofolate synthase / folylpolyglutamate synthase